MQAVSTGELVTAPVEVPVTIVVCILSFVANNVLFIPGRLSLTDEVNWLEKGLDLFHRLEKNIIRMAEIKCQEKTDQTTPEI